MTETQRAAMRLALEALTNCSSQHGHRCNRCDDEVDEGGRVAGALIAALAEPEPEPVAWMYHGIRHDGTPHDNPSLIWRPEYMDAMSASKGVKATPLYTTPPARRPLTDEDIQAEWRVACEKNSRGTTGELVRAFARGVERKITGGNDE